MDTEHTLRATELKELYETITMKGLEKDERLDALLTLKTTVRVWNGPHVIIVNDHWLQYMYSLLQEHDCKLTREIVELIDREADLLVRDTKATSLEGVAYMYMYMYMCIY